MHAIRMLVDAEGSPNGHQVHLYVAGEVYSHESTPRMSAYLMEAFVSSKRAVEVDAAGNPVSTPASRRASKSASAPAEPTASDLGSPAEDITLSEPEPPTEAPAPESAPEAPAK